MPLDKQFHVTFGSDATDDGYYLEVRDDARDPYSFLTFIVDDEAKLHVVIGKGHNATELELTTLMDIIATSQHRLVTAKQEWNIAREKFDL